ncbi:MAG: peptide/nickel transport system permease protein [Thermomicrobiales bacterium]|jgi:peptide/nickel transport system permease protein|nr:peptide/nickel transport system permease protein [Thermomicrobiales bacterium]MEA2527910.1 peptide/nickel transport system permease protein [Thermomicrobiales bacterium]
MGSFLLSRAVRFGGTLLGLSFLIFMLTRLIPGDPAVLMLGRGASPEAVTILRHELGLDRPAVIQFFSWLAKMIRGDMGTSTRLDLPVSELVFERYPRTISFVLFGSAIALVYALATGTLAARKRNSWVDFLVTSVSLFGISVPTFWLGVLLVLFMSVRLQWLPASGYVGPTEDFGKYVKHLLMPGTALGLAVGSLMSRVVRSSLLEALNEGYVTVARAKGLSERVVMTRYALRNALVPIITVFGIQLGYMLGGSVVIEQVFTYPGIGQLVVDAIFRRDYPLVQAAVLAYATTFLLVNLLTDVAYAVADPRLRRAGR